MRIAAFCALLLLTTLSVADPLRIGTPDYSPPFSINIDNENHYAGFDIDIMDQICKRIDRKCVYVHTPFVEAFVGVEQHVIDLAIGNITITPLREQQFLFSLPYLQSYAQYLTKPNYGIKNDNDIKGKTVGLEHLTVFAYLVKQRFGDSVKIKVYNRLASVLEALNAHEVDVAIIDQATAEIWYANSDGALQLVGKPMHQGFGYGIMTTLGNTQLIDEINRALLSMEADGTYINIYRTYFGAIE